MSTPIATYREQRFDGKRFFELYPDRMQIRGTQRGGTDFEMAVPLNALEPQPAKMRVQNKAFGQGLWMVMGALAIDLVLPYFMRLEQWLAPAVFISCIGIGGLLLMLATMRKEEYVVFSNTAGVQILSVARLGPDARQFDAFRDQIIAQIEVARAGTSGRL